MNISAIVASDAEDNAPCMRGLSTYTAFVKKIIGLLTLGGALAGLSAAESIQVEIEFMEKVYVPGEDISAKICIVNYSGRDLVLGDKPGWLNLIVKAESAGRFRPLKRVELIYPFTVPTGKEVKRAVKLGEFFRFDDIGRYTIQPIIRVGAGPRDYQPGHPKAFDVANPATMHEQPFGVKSGPDERVHTRLYTIQRLTRSRQTAFVKVSDQRTGELIGLVNIGSIVSFGNKVDHRLDRLSNLHTLHHSGARSYRHHVVTPTGMLVTRETFLVDRSGRKPQLMIDQEGMGRVIGGRPYPQPDDLLPFKVPAPPPAALSKN